MLTTLGVLYLMISMVIGTTTAIKTINSLDNISFMHEFLHETRTMYILCVIYELLSCIVAWPIIMLILIKYSFDEKNL